VFSTVVAFLIFFWAVRRFGAGLAAMVSYLVPIAALTLAFVVLGERPLPLQLVGALVIVLGVRLAARPAPALERSSVEAGTA
jgi:O-acetylserine/cysteine efflux transporter